MRPAIAIAAVLIQAGLYDIALQWEPDEELSRVLQAQLGLRLERQQVPVDFIIIDSAEMPTDN